MSDELAKSTRQALIVGVALMLLLAATVAAYLVDLGVASAFVSLAIAAVKASLVVLFFMEIRVHKGTTRLFATAGLFWLVILITLALSDYLTRV